MTWIGAAVTREDLASADIEEWLRKMSERRMEEGGELCPLELLPSSECESDLRELLARLGLDQRRNIEVYSLAA